MSQQEELGKMFVGGLSWETTQESLCRFFSRYGEVIDCVVMKNNESGRSRGFGFVTFKDQGCVDIVLSSGPHNLDGRTIDPKACNPRSMHKASSKGNNPKIFLGGLPSNITETDLRNFFSKFGKVMEVVIMYDQERKRSRGFGFLSFETEDCVDRVCAEHYLIINGKQVECKRAEPREGRPSNSRNSNHWNGSGMGMGGPGGMPPPPMGGPPMVGAPPMPPMANGMAGYQHPGWGPAPQQGGFGPQGPFGAPPPAPGYQGWGAPQGYGSYPPPGPQFGAPPQGYSGYGPYGYNWPGAPGFPPPNSVIPAPVPPPPSAVGATSGGAVAPTANASSAASAAGGSTTSGTEATTPTQGASQVSPPGTNNASGQNAAGAASQPSIKPEYGYADFWSFQGAMGNYAQDASNYGPSRYNASQEGFGGGGNSNNANYSGQGDSQGSSYSGNNFSRGGGQSQQYHPYRRQ